MTVLRAAILTILALPAAAETGAAVTTALDRFQTACATALSDPDAYIASLTLPGPAGEPGLYQSPDRQYLRVHTTQSEGITDSVEYAGLVDRLERACRIEAVLPGFPEAAVVDDALRPLLDARAAEVVGGLTDTVEPIWEPGDTPVAYEGEGVFVYRATGLIPGIDATAAIVIRGGTVTFAAARTVRVEATQ